MTLHKLYNYFLIDLNAQELIYRSPPSSQVDIGCPLNTLFDFCECVPVFEQCICDHLLG